MTRRAMAATTLLTIFLTDCTVGPNYSRPDVPAAPAYRGPDNSTVSGNASLADEKWWELFKDVTLQQLIHTALEQNYDLRIAASRVIQAQQQVIITRSNQFPTVGACQRCQIAGYSRHFRRLLVHSGRFESHRLVESGFLGSLPPCHRRRTSEFASH
jgi:hypothetical protein